MSNDRLSEIYEKLGEIAATCKSIEADLEYHIKRTDLLEKRMRPLETHIKVVQTLAVITTSVLAAVTAIFGVFL